MRGKTVLLHIKRSRWTLLESHQIIKRDWNLVAQGTRMTSEFVAFLKDILDTNTVSASRFGEYYKTNGKRLQFIYKNHLSHYNEWNQKTHESQWLFFGKNLGKYLSLDETSLSNGKLYTILTNKDARGNKGSIIAIIKGTRAIDVITVINKISESRRNMVKEVTVDMAGSMNLITKKSYPKTEIVTDRFHVQKFAFEAVQEQRIRLRWGIIEMSRKAGEIYKPALLSNGEKKDNY